MSISGVDSVMAVVKSNKHAPWVQTGFLQSTDLLKQFSSNYKLIIYDHVL